MKRYIDRQMAANIANYAADEHPYDKDSEKPETFSDYNRGWEDACLYIQSKLETMKPALCASSVETFDVSMERVHELVKAEVEGRLLVLPFKPGTEYWGHCHIRGASPISHGYFTLPRIPTLGKDAWLTREEAEAALKDE